MRGVRKREQQGGEEEVTKIGKTEKSAAGLHVFVLHFFAGEFQGGFHGRLLPFAFLNDPYVFDRFGERQ